MSAFSTYLELGFRHILDVKGHDHILFVIVLCAAYEFKHWKQILILVTAFTVGHSLTLALSALDVMSVDSATVELLIAVTILLTAVQNITIPKPGKTAMQAKYFMALFFGLVHGLGFSNYFKMLLGKESNILLPLFSFNLGIELGQLLIVAALLVFFFLAGSVLRIKPRDYNLFLSGAAFGVALLMVLERI